MVLGALVASREMSQTNEGEGEQRGEERGDSNKDHSGGRKKNGVPGKRAAGNLDQHKA